MTVSKFTCLECKSTFSRSIGKVRQSVKNGYKISFCSDRCRRKYKTEHKMNRKEICARYREKKKLGFNNLTPAENKYLSNKYFGGLREVVIQRDDYKCSQCGKGDHLIVHHLNQNKQENELYNLTTLCRSCHHRVHGLIRGGLNYAH